MGVHRWCRLLVVCGACAMSLPWSWGGAGAAVASADPAPSSDAGARNGVPAGDTGSSNPSSMGSDTGPRDAAASGDAGRAEPPARGAPDRAGDGAEGSGKRHDAPDNTAVSVEVAARNATALAAEKDAATRAVVLTAKDVAAKGLPSKEDLKKVDTALNRVADLGIESERQKETSLGAGLVNASVSGLSDSNAPQWSLLADAAVTSLDFSQPTLSLGLERATPKTLAMVAFRKNAADNSVSGAAGDPAFGRTVLAPALASFSIATHIEWRLRAYIQCNTDCRLPVGIRQINTKKSAGLYFSGQAAYAKLIETGGTRPDGSAVSGYFSPLAVSVGGIYRLEGEMPDGAKLGTRKLGLAGYAGVTARVISGDLDGADRMSIFGTAKRYYGGVEAGAMVQIGNVLVDPKIIALTNNRDRIPGLTGLQLQISLSFLLPWTVLSDH
jgi:hypothetical protein